MVNRSLVSVVDDDASVRELLPDLLKEFGFAVQTFSSAEDFLKSSFVARTKCLILDVAMPGMSGPELQRIGDLNVAECTLAIASAQNAAAEDLFIEISRSVDVGDRDKK